MSSEFSTIADFVLGKFFDKILEGRKLTLIKHLCQVNQRKHRLKY